ncbi:MAG TPA: Smr/MutS family protein [Bacilli bacterium]|nr:Smr/MutS family protein [Bacilli bacterium]
MQTINLLEFNVIRDALSQYTKTELGANFALNLLAYETENAAEAALGLLKEAETLYVKLGQPPFSNSVDLRLVLNAAKEGNLLSPRDLGLIRRDILIFTEVLSFLSTELSNFPFLNKELQAFSDLKPLLATINKAISPNDDIKDNATPALKKIRRNILNKEQEITRTINQLLTKYAAYANENLITMREGHYVIPISARYKNKVQGVIYDISNSGQTLFIEPSEVTLLNSDLIGEQNEERIEINRILRELTAAVLSEYDALINNNILLAELDFLFAKAKYGHETNSFIPTFSTNNTLSLPDARHPLIPSDQVVSNTYTLSDENFIVIISGPNAGGKTVSLKTIGLLSYMAKAGLMLPTSREAVVPFYEKIYIAIGDTQSLSSNLSTFSGHIKNLEYILNHATKSDLVLLDELGTGTSPEEGEALAIAITNYLHHEKIPSVISSHYAKLKAFAFTKPGMTNASMAFSDEELRPLYKYHHNVPGLSYGLFVAEKFGIKKAIIKEARRNLNEDAAVFEHTIRELEKELHEVTRLKEELLKDEKTLAQKLTHLKIQEETLKRLQQELHLAKKDAVAEYVTETKAKLERLLEEAFKTGGKAHEIIELKKAVDEVLETPEEGKIKLKESFMFGDYVLVKTLGVNGVITKLTGKTATLKLDNGKIMRVKLTQITQAKKKAAPKAKAATISYEQDYIESVPLELNVIGKRVDEALRLVETYLDKCLLKNYSEVRIIHGFGTGALRSAIHEYLRSSSYVKSFRLGREHEGHGGATVVSL